MIKHIFIGTIELPPKPEFTSILDRSYNQISFSLKKYPEDGLEYNTTIQVAYLDGQKALDDIVLRNSGYYGRIGKGGTLQNGTTYVITVVASSIVGQSEPLVMNFTIPRMGKFISPS